MNRVGTLLAMKVPVCGKYYEKMKQIVFCLLPQFVYLNLNHDILINVSRKI